MPPFRHKNNLAIAAILFVTIVALGLLVGYAASGLLFAATIIATAMLLWCYTLDAVVWSVKVLMGIGAEGKE